MSELKPAAWQFKNVDGEWRNGTEHHNHYKNTVDAGYEVRHLYAIPEGYALVPVDPTDAMIDEIRTDERFTNRAMRVRYQSMLNAAGAYEVVDAQFQIGSVVDEEV